ncbi:hypothetical protein BOX37_10740 [Nocardia mangyaensis]|uniref:Right handed beta helix domain-containing protein n=1 Tax=Nocardia mangyaensis TaxID=2213200 RepID=A0A1J0VQN8_9NOCA|nr:right-handed parallel beta-helix repeat-containing protein [Nocardia mangyaensis]APE34348.1 hypothetical protein BOX37_10740 [Nocardia mangyaensis]
MSEFFVDPSGDDSWPGSETQPFATLDRAVRAASETTGAVVVQLRAGCHILTDPLEITRGDITFQAYGCATAEQEEAVVSGGRRISGWQHHEGSWVAEVGELDTRHLSVDGRRVERASIEALPGDATCTGTGYVTDVTVDWRSPADVEFVHRGVYPWTEARCAVASTTVDADGTTTVTMAQPAFGHAHTLYHFAWDGHVSRGPGLPTRIENDPTFLTEPGTFVLDRSRLGRHLLRYLPLPGEDPEHTLVVAPVLEMLVRVTGVADIAFRGMTFADATWLRPAAEGFLHYHGGHYYTGGKVETVTIEADRSWVTVPGESSVIPACVRIENSTGVRIDGCRFTHLGATGLGLTGGADLVVRDCDFDILAASGITATDSRDVVVEDNRIHHIGMDYSGAPGIAISETSACTVAHNHIAHTPHCGIVVGSARGTRILHNLVTDTMTALADGGGIYLSGSQGDDADNGALVRGNVIEDVHTPYNFGLYTDYGAAWVTVEDNVVRRADSSSVLQVFPPLDNVVYRRNFWDADPVGSDDVPPGVVYADNTTLADPTALDAATATLRAMAGPRRDEVDHLELG